MYCILYTYVHSVFMYNLIRVSWCTYTKDLAKASCVHYDIRNICLFSVISVLSLGLSLNFFQLCKQFYWPPCVHQLDCLIFWLLISDFWSTVLRQEGVGKRALLYPLVRASVTAHARRRGWRIELEKVHLECAPALSLSAHEVSISLARSPR